MTQMETLETFDEYRYRLRRLGVKRIGEGYFSQVYAHPKNSGVAVKLVLRPDPEYIKYAKLCMKQPNVWLPKIYGIHKAEFYDEEDELDVTRYIVFTERLRRAKRKEIRAAIDQIVAGTEAEDEGITDFFQIDPYLWRKIQRQSQDYEIRELAGIMKRINPEDIHDANVMMRGDQLVFTDPVASDSYDS